LANEMDKIRLADDAFLKVWLGNNFGRFGIEGARVKVIRLLLQQGTSFHAVLTPAHAQRVSEESPILVFLLSDPAQELEAFAMATNLNSSKSNVAMAINLNSSKSQNVY